MKVVTVYLTDKISEQAIWRLRESAFFGFKYLACFIFLCLIFIFSSSSFAGSPPTDPVERCNVIHAYEGLCGNQRPNECLGLPGIDYFHNLAHQSTWDNYYWLCVDTNPSKDRYSHECIEFYGLISTCSSTVPDLVEYPVAATTNLQQSSVKPAPNNFQVAGNKQIVATLCGLSPEQNNEVSVYQSVCGNALPASCSGDPSLVSDYRAICGEERPCECLSEKHCGPECAGPGSPPVNPLPSDSNKVIAEGGSAPGSDGGLNVGKSGAGAQGSGPGETVSPASSNSSHGCSLGEVDGTSQPLEFTLLSMLILGPVFRRILCH